MRVVLSDADLHASLSAWRIVGPIQVTAIPGGFTSDVWIVDSSNGRFVAKYCYDTQADFDEGLRAAEALDDAGIVCAAPIRTRAGRLSVLVEGPHGRKEPLALLRYVPGVPFDWHAAGAAQRAGEFLGQIHTIWLHARQLQPQDRISGYLLGITPEVAAQPGLQALIDQAVANVRQFEAESPVTHGPIIGDYMEILLDAATDSIGLIDCGSVGWGALLFDLAIMIDELPRSDEVERQRFLQAYLSSSPIQPAELVGLRHYQALHWAQLAKYFAWRLAHDITMGDETPNANADSLAEIRAELERLVLDM